LATDIAAFKEESGGHRTLAISPPVRADVLTSMKLSDIFGAAIRDTLASASALGYAWPSRDRLVIVYCSNRFTRELNDES
jgi:hypothetical protein